MFFNFGQGSSSLTEVRRAISWLLSFEVVILLSRFAAHRHIPPDLAASVRCAPVQDRIERPPELNLGCIKVLGLADKSDPGIWLCGPGDRPEPRYSAGGSAHPHDAAYGKPPMLASFDVDAEVVVALAPEKQLAGEIIDLDGVGRHFRRDIRVRIGCFKRFDMPEPFEWLMIKGIGLTALLRLHAGAGAADGIGIQESPCATTWLKRLGTNRLDKEMLMKRVKVELIEMTKNDQQPWINMDPATEVYLAEN